MVIQRPLWTRNFALMWMGESVSVFGAELTVLAFPLIALGALQTSSAEVPLIAVASGVGTILGLAAGGPLADHRRQKTMMASLNAIRLASLVVTAGCLAVHRGPFVAMCAAAFVIAGCTAIYDSAFSSLVPRAVHRELLPSANAWFGGMRSAANIGSGGLGGILLHVASGPVVLLLDAITYLVATLALVGLRLPGRCAATPSVSWRERYGAGFAYLRRDRVQRVVTLANAHFNFFTTAFQSILVVFAVRQLGLDSVAVGIAITIGGGLGILGVAVSGHVHDRVRLGIVLSSTLAVPGLLAVALALVPPARDVAGTLLAVGSLALLEGIWLIAVIVNVAGCETLKQTTVPDTILGRFSAAVRLVTWGVDPVGAALAAGLLLVLSLKVATVLLGIGVASSALWIVCSPALRRCGRLSDLATVHR